MIISNIVKQNFSRHPEDYDYIAKTQRKVAKKVANLVESKCSTKAMQNILEIGCGTGFLTRDLIQRIPNAQFTITDISPAMLHFCKKNIPKSNNIVKFAINDITKGCPNGPFDLITSSLAFQWVENFNKLIQELYTHLSSNGSLIFTILITETFKNIATLFEKHNLIFPMPKLLSVQDIKNTISCFKNIAVIEKTYSENYNSIKDFLNHIHKVGAGNATGTQIPISKLRQILKNNIENKELIVKYKVAFVICKK